MLCLPQKVFVRGQWPLLLLTQNIGFFNTLNFNIIKLLEWELKTNRRIGKKAKSCFNQGDGQKSTKMAPIFLVLTVFTKIRTINSLWCYARQQPELAFWLQKFKDKKWSFCEFLRHILGVSICHGFFSNFHENRQQ